VSARKHAILAPSAASRWLVCSKSARLEESCGETQSDYADEGSLAHALGDIYIREMLNMVTLISARTALEKTAAWKKYYNAEMEEHCSNYAKFVVMKFNEIKAHDKHATIILEEELDISEYVPESWGHVDVGIISDYKAVTIDLKYGKGVYVDVAENKQQMLYALGLIVFWRGIYDPAEVEMNVYQPRIENISESTMNTDALMFWAEEVLKPAAQLAFDGGDNFVIGDHCKFCNFRFKCKAYSDQNLEIARYEFKEPDALTDDDIADILERIPVLVNWVNMIQEYALKQAVDKGKSWPGFKLVEGRSNRRYVDAAKVEKALIKAKLEPALIYKPRELFGIGQMTKNIGAELFNKLLKNLIVKPPGSLTLVAESDKRSEHNSLSKAQEDFAED
jgi:hypothetical protein